MFPKRRKETVIQYKDDNRKIKKFTFIQSKMKNLKTLLKYLIERWPEFIVYICIFLFIVDATYYFIYTEKIRRESNLSLSPVMHNVSTNEIHPKLFNNATNTQSYPTLSTNVSETFNIGDIVGIKFFNGMGLVRQKILGVNGYTYSVRLKDNSHRLYDSPFSSWELYKPTKEMLTPLLLQDY